MPHFNGIHPALIAAELNSLFSCSQFPFVVQLPTHHGQFYRPGKVVQGDIRRRVLIQRLSEMIGEFIMESPQHFQTDTMHFESRLIQFPILKRRIHCRAELYIHICPIHLSLTVGQPFQQRLFSRGNHRLTLRGYHCHSSHPQR